MPLRCFPALGLRLALLLLGFSLGGIGFVHPASAVDPWRQALTPRAWQFPRDHGRHDAFQTEWCYFTGNLRDGQGRPFGFQWTLFRQGVAREPADRRSLWSMRDLYLAHVSITDGVRKRFHYGERVARSGPGLAGAAAGGLDLRLLRWTASFQGGAIHLFAEREGLLVRLELTPLKPVVLHGDRGLSRKGFFPGQASHYYSLTRLATRGVLRVPGEDGDIAVTGTSWFDHEFTTSPLKGEQEGWDWFGLHLADGQDLMAFRLRQRGGVAAPFSSGTLVAPDGLARDLGREGWEWSVLERWRSPASGGVYPGRWRLRHRGAALDLTVQALIPDQELMTAASTGVTYWEGAVTGQGKVAGRPATAEGYMELTGYAGGVAGLKR